MLISFCNLFHSLFLSYSKPSPINPSAGLLGLGPMFFEVHHFVRLAAIHKVLGEQGFARVADPILCEPPAIVYVRNTVENRDLREPATAAKWRRLSTGGSTTTRPG
jgi:hypothetical protein